MSSCCFPWSGEESVTDCTSNSATLEEDKLLVETWCIIVTTITKLYLQSVEGSSLYQEFLLDYLVLFFQWEEKGLFFSASEQSHENHSDSVLYFPVVRKDVAWHESLLLRAKSTTMSIKCGLLFNFIKLNSTVGDFCESHLEQEAIS